MKSKTTAILLSFFLEGLGVHRFYLGQIGLGFLYLIFFWTFIPLFVSLIDFIVFLAMSDQEFDKKYNTSIITNVLKNYRNPAQLNTADEIEKLHALKEKGIITEAEYQYKKSQLL